MRVLHINCNYMTTPLHQLMIENMDRQGVENTVFAPVCKGVECAVKPNENVIASPCFNSLDRCSFDWKQKKILRAAEDAVDFSKIDIIHAYTLYTDGNSAMKLSKKYGIPYVVAVRDTDVNVFFKYRPWLIKRGIKILREAKAVFFLSETYKKNVIENYIPQEYREEISAKAQVVPNGIDSFWIDNAYREKDLEASLSGIESKTLRVICVAKICRRKNITTLQKALSMLRGRGWDTRLTVIGKGEDKSLLEEICADEHTVYHKEMPKEELIDYYRASDVFVLPSVRETFGLVYAEAITQGLPILYSAGQGFDGQFDEGEVGYRVDAENPQDICDKLEKLALEYKKLSEKCLDSSGRFDWSDITARYSRIYESISGGTDR